MSTNPQPNTPVECPRCGTKNTYQTICWNCKYDLLKPKQIKTSGKPKMHWAVATLIAVCSCTVIIFSLKQLYHDVYQSNATSRAIANVSQVQNQGQWHNPSDLQLMGSGTMSGPDGFYVTGNIFNSSTKTYTHIRVPVEIYRKNVKVITAVAKVDDMAPRTSGKFQVAVKGYVDGDNIVMRDIMGSPAE